VTPNDLIKELDKGKFKPVYYFYGPEDYRIKEAEKAVVRKFLPKSLLKTNHTTLSASKQKIDDILTELSVFPMLGENQIFTISDIQNFSPQDIEKIFKLLSPPDPNRVVILTSPSSKTPRKRSKALNILTSKAAAIEFGKFSGDRSAKKALAMLKEYEIEIEPEALNILVMLAGGDMGGLVSEINKLVDYVGPSGKITKADVAAVGSDYQVFQVYELADHIAHRDLDKALDTLSFLMRKGETVSRLLFWMSEHFIDLYLVQNDKPLSPGKAAISWKYKKQVANFTNSQLEEIIRLMADADTSARSNIKPERMIIEKLIFEICGMEIKGSHG
jgi:DNA polymerase-3 subunit delta